MKQTRFTESQIMAVLKEGESGVSVPELCKRPIIPVLPKP
jgi:hypothetical protein